MKTSTSEGKHGIQWTARNQLDDLDFADDLALLSRTHEQMQMKTASVAAVSASVGLSIHKGKTKVLKFKAENNNPITLDGETLENVESFTYLGSIIDEQGGSDADVKARIGKAMTAFLLLKNIWNSKQLSINIKFGDSRNITYVKQLCKHISARICLEERISYILDGDVMRHFIPSNINDDNNNNNNNSSNWTLDISMKRSIQSNCKRFLFSTTNNNNNNIFVKISE
ncbi:unnamed protein product [Schistosoma margrebowiei]|uniref:Uncharacterized protein n=1 Tax=Schistosoma margrebowiei TaxID=48269 RepID=A0A183N846_9TREM|nr:unnamed protein product [Schistosoma margrebowiei]